jgi:hypothetical protein
MKNKLRKLSVVTLVILMRCGDTWLNKWMSKFRRNKGKETAHFHPENTDKRFLRNHSIYVIKCMTSNPRRPLS